MEQQKRRVVQAENPGYPTLRHATVGRRRFLALLGGAVSLVCLGGMAYADPPDAASPDTEPSPPPEPKLGGMPPRPEYFIEVRLPTTNSHPLTLQDNSFLSYVVTCQGSFGDFEDYVRNNNNAILTHLDRILKPRNYEDFSKPAALEEIKEDIRQTLLWYCQKDYGGSSGTIQDVKLEVPHQRSSGDVAGCSCRTQPAVAQGLPWLLLLAGLPLLHRRNRIARESTERSPNKT